MGLGDKIVARLLLISIVLLSISFFISSSFAATELSSFGQVSVGSSSKTTFGGVFVSNFTSPQNIGNITEVEVYLATGGTSAYAVLYSDNGERPDILLAASPSLNIDGTSGSWIKFDLPFQASPNTVYWMGIAFQAAATYYYSPNIDGRLIYSSPTFEALTEFPTVIPSSGDYLSVYANYLPSTVEISSNNTFDWVQSALLVTAFLGIVTAGIVVLFYFRRKKA
jgi:hypothetical protein